MPYADPAKEKERQRARRKTPEWKRYQLEWQKKNRWRYQVRMKRNRLDWNAKNPEKVKAQKRKTYLKYRERFLAKQKRYYYSNRGDCIERMKKYDSENHSTVSEYRLTYQKARRAKIKGCATNKTAVIFYDFVRSKKSIPCYYCGRRVPGKKAHIDHVIAVARLGNHASDNLCASCPDCNHRKSAKLPSELEFLSQPCLNL